MEQLNRSEGLQGGHPSGKRRRSEPLSSGELAYAILLQFIVLDLYRGIAAAKAPMTRRELLGYGAIGLTLRRSAVSMPGMPFATEWTQLLNYATLAAQLGQSVKIVQSAIQALRYMEIAGRLLTGSQFGQLAQNLILLARNVRQGHALAYTLSHLDIAFRAAFPGYLNTGAPFDPQYRRWSEISLDTITGILGSIGEHASDLNTDAGIMDFLSKKQGSVIGETQAIQAGTEIASFQAGQLLKLRQLMSAQITQTGVALGRQIQVEQAQIDLTKKAVGQGHYVAKN